MVKLERNAAGEAAARIKNLKTREESIVAIADAAARVQEAAKRES